MTFRSILPVTFALATVLGSDISNAQQLESTICKTCQPCEDFYDYVNQEWLAANPLPNAYPIWGPWGMTRERNLTLLREILEDASQKARSGKAKPGSVEQKIGDFYASGMDSLAREREGLVPLKPLFDSIDKLTSPGKLPALIANFQRLGVDNLFYIGVEVDAKHSDKMITSTWQSGLGLPDRDYYSREDEDAVQIREAYRAHIAKYFELAFSLSSAETAAAAKRVYDIEERLAAASMKREETRNSDLTYNYAKISKLSSLMPNLDHPKYLRLVGLERAEDIVIGQPGFMRAVDSMLVEVPMANWREYFRWKTLSYAAPYLSHQFVDEDFAWSKELSGTKEQHPLWKRRIRTVDNAIGEALGQAFVARAFKPEAKLQMKEMIANLKAALREDIQTLSWIDNNTRKKAIEKLNSFVDKIGYPEKWRDYSKLTIDRGPLLGNVLRSNEFEFNRSVAKLGKPVDRSEWGMTPPTINAYYNATMNVIVFPAGILQPPFFDATADAAYNYGAIGTIIGHEMTHGFDDQGAKFDAKGNLENWWTDADLNTFRERSKCIVDQFGAYTVLDSIKLNGELVVGESIADLGGIKLAYAAYQKYLDKHGRKTIGGFTPEQRFFLAYGRIWATNARPQFEKMLAVTDPHPPGRYRVTGPLSNFAPFAKAFGCQAGSKMVRAAGCEVW